MKLFVHDIKAFLFTQPNFSASSDTILKEFGVELSKENIANLAREIQYTNEIKREYRRIGNRIQSFFHLDLIILAESEEDQSDSSRQ